MSDPVNQANPPREPLLSVGTITALGTTVLALIAAFGVPLTDTQQTAILAALAVLAPLVVALAGRARVYSPATVKARLAGRHTR